MKMPTRPKPIPALILFTVGVLFAMALSILATWGDYEAASYGFAKRASTPLMGLNCPIVMTKDETQTVSLKITNRSDHPIFPSIRTDISTSFQPIITTESIELAPGESHIVKWSIGQKNIDLGQFIFVNVLVYAAYPNPARENTCGVFVLPIHGNSRLILILATAISLLSLGSGTYLLQRSNMPIKQKRPLLFLTFAILLTLVVSFMGLWIPAILLLAISILTMITMLSSVLS